MRFFNLYCTKKCNFVEKLTSPKCFAFGIANLTISVAWNHQNICQPKNMTRFSKNGQNVHQKRHDNAALR